MRYEEADDSLINVFSSVLESRFPQYSYLNFKLVYDLKRRTKNSNLILANIELASPKIKFFSQDKKAEEGYDYVLFIDKCAWELASDKDKRRLISHELRHVFIDELGRPKIVGHELEDFYAELELNKDDPEWVRKLSILVMDVYEQEKENSKNKKQNNN